MKSRVSGLDWLRLIVVAGVLMLSFWVLGSIWLALLWSYIAGVIVFRIDNRPSGYLALALLILTPIALSLELDTLAEVFAVNVYYLLCIMVFSEIWSGHKLSWPWLENVLDRFGNWLIELLTKIPNWLWISGITFISLILISGRYFVSSGIPHNSFLDMGGMVVLTDVWEQFRIGWFYQFGRAWNILTSNWAVLYTGFLGWIAGNFYLGIKIHQFMSIIVAAVGAIMLWRALLPKLENRVAIISSQVLVALVYAFNPFYLSVLNGVVEFGVAYSLLPWIILAWLKLLKSSNLKWWGIVLRIIITGVILSFATLVSGITLVFTNILPLMVIMFGFALVNLKSRVELLRRGALFIGVWLVVALMGFHVLIPTFFGYRQGAGILDESQTEERIAPFVKDYYSPNVEELAYIQNKEGIVSEEIGYDLRSMPLDNRLIWVFWVSLGLGSIMWFRKNKYILPLWLGSALAGYLALGYSRSWLYRVLNEYFPYFWGLRTPGRFMMVFALGVAVLSGLGWYYIVSEAKTRAWKLGAVFAFVFALVVLLVSARYQAVQMYTFWTIPSMDTHMEGVERTKKILDELNPDMKYRILDLSRDDDGSWNHTRVISADQRYLNEFEKVLINYPAKDWGEILQDYNIKYIVTTDYDDYCDDRFENDRNLVSCYLLQRKDGLSKLTSTVEGYTIYEVEDVKSYVSGDNIAQDFTYNPIVKTGDEKQKVTVAEMYSSQFRWTCGRDLVIDSNSEKDGLVQASILPANSDCKFGYSKSLEVAVADWIFYGLLGVSVVGGMFFGIRILSKNKK
ncbi:MAG: hypothetical protein WD512_03155 [Candidatus Paceibacterota bacterium]